MSGQALTTADLGPLADDPATVAQAQRQAEERRELFRIAGQSALDRSRGGRDLDPEARRWAQHWASVKPLGRALGTGEPPAPARIDGAQP